MTTEKRLTGYATIDKPWEKFYEGINKSTLFLNTTPYQGLIYNNHEHLSETAMEYLGQKISFGQMIKCIDCAAKSLEEYGIKKGDFVTICSTTTPEVVYAFYAISKIGAVANVISPFYTPEEFMNRVNECESKMVMVVDKFYPKFKEELSRNGKITIIQLPLIHFPFENKLRLIGKSDQISWRAFIKSGFHRIDANIDPYEVRKPQAMVYSSGTTGASKGIILSVDSFQKLINAYGNSGFDTSRMQTVYQNIPPWHSTGLSLGINFPLSFGVKVCTDPRFDHDVFIKNVLKFKPEYILTNTSMYQAFTLEKSKKRLKGKSLAFLKYPVEGGEPLTQKDITSIERIFRDHGSTAKLLNGYGQCECGATITTDITGHKFSNNASGIPLPDITQIGIFDDDNKELKYGQRGNILAKTEIGMLHYYKNPAATNAFFYIDANGDSWSRTGDIGYINEDGSLVVLGRKSDYSIIDNEKIFNFDVERAILSSDKVKLCEIQSHPKKDNILVAHIVWENEIASEIALHPEKEIEYLQEIQQVTMQIMQTVKAVPNCFCVRDGFPSAPSGKRDIQFVRNNIDRLIEVPFINKQK